MWKFALSSDVGIRWNDRMYYIAQVASEACRCSHLLFIYLFIMELVRVVHKKNKNVTHSMHNIIHNQ